MAADGRQQHGEAGTSRGSRRQQRRGDSRQATGAPGQGPQSEAAGREEDVEGEARSSPGGGGACGKHGQHGQEGQQQGRHTDRLLGLKQGGKSRLLDSGLQFEGGGQRLQAAASPYSSCHCVSPVLAGSAAALPPVRRPALPCLPCPAPAQLAQCTASQPHLLSRIARLGLLRCPDHLLDQPAQLCRRDSHAARCQQWRAWTTLGCSEVLPGAQRNECERRDSWRALSIS